MSLVQVDNIFQSYGAHNVLERVSLDVCEGEFISLVGASGCGKSTFLRLLLDQERPTRCEIYVDGAPLRGEPSRSRGIVFQRYSVFPHMTVRDKIVAAEGLGANVFGILTPRARRAARARADDALDRIGLAAMADAWPAALSGGMQQRRDIAQAMAARPRILIPDEPFGARSHHPADHRHEARRRHHPDTSKLQGWKSMRAEADIPEGEWGKEKQWSLRMGLTGADSIDDRSIPTSARGELPHYAGINTFLKAPYTEDVTEVGGYDATVLGAPFDGGTTCRPFTRFGPQGIRKISALYTPCNHEMGIDLREQMSLCDAGDIITIPANIEKTFDQISRAVAHVFPAGRCRSFRVAITRSAFPGCGASRNAPPRRSPAQPYVGNRCRRRPADHDRAMHRRLHGRAGQGRVRSPGSSGWRGTGITQRRNG